MPLTTYTAGEVLTAASLNANFSFAATNGLALVKTQTIGSAVASVTITDAFSSTYDNYRITVTGGAGSTSTDISLRLGATATGYSQQGIILVYNSNTVSSDRVDNGAQFIAGSTSANGIFATYEFINPNVASRTGYEFSVTQPLTSTGVIKNGSGFLNDATQYTAFTITWQTGTFTGGTIRVYGYANS